MPDLPDFTSHTWQQSRENPQLAVSILDGKGKFMPSFRGRVKADQVFDLVGYVRAFGPSRLQTRTSLRQMILKNSIAASSRSGTPCKSNSTNCPRRSHPNLEIDTDIRFKRRG
jgi:hypothetical protein